MSSDTLHTNADFFSSMHLALYYYNFMFYYKCKQISSDKMCTYSVYSSSEWLYNDFSCWFEKMFPGKYIFRLSEKSSQLFNTMSENRFKFINVFTCLHGFIIILKLNIQLPHSQIFKPWNKNKLNQMTIKVGKHRIFQKNNIIFQNGYVLVDMIVGFVCHPVTLSCECIRGNVQL